jgi:poly(3-hydroxybutyrate) depolymerase
MARQGEEQLMKKSLIVWFLVTCWSPALFGAEAVDSKSLVSAFWLATSSEEQAQAANQLIASARDTGMLYRWLKTGPDYPVDAPRGYLERERVAPDGTRFPYVVLIPESYDPTRSYPVEFLLHGGVNRGFPAEPGSWWRSGFDSLRSETRITVLPAAWNEAFWWFQNQAENLPAILREIKRDYNVADDRVFLTGISDGGTGAYFFAFKQHTEWAAFLPFIGHPGVLRNPAGEVSYQLYFENLMGKPLYMVNGEEDPLYPASSLEPFINVMREANIKHVFRAIEGGGHNTAWLPDEAAAIEQFKLDNPRDPLPDSIQWVTDSTGLFNRNHWVIVEELARENQPGMVRVSKNGNVINVDTTYVNVVTLLLNPEEVDFSQPVAVYVNGSLRQSEPIREDAEVLLKWAGRDLDRSLLFTAELEVRVGD